MFCLFTDEEIEKYAEIIKKDYDMGNTQRLAKNQNLSDFGAITNNVKQTVQTTLDTWGLPFFIGWIQHVFHIIDGAFTAASKEKRTELLNNFITALVKGGLNGSINSHNIGWDGVDSKALASEYFFPGKWNQSFCEILQHLKTIHKISISLHTDFCKDVECKAKVLKDYKKVRDLALKAQSVMASDPDNFKVILKELVKEVIIDAYYWLVYLGKDSVKEITRALTDTLKKLSKAGLIVAVRELTDHLPELILKPYNTGQRAGYLAQIRRQI